jgi:hypothetical protein
MISQPIVIVAYALLLVPIVLRRFRYLLISYEFLILLTTVVLTLMHRSLPFGVPVRFRRGGSRPPLDTLLSFALP